MTRTQTSAKRTSASEPAAERFTVEERAAMKERAKEIKAAKRRAGRADEQAAVLAKIAEMPEPDRALAERVHAVIAANAPDLTDRLWYGMPAYVKDGKIVCFFQAAAKFKSRYATLGFDAEANLDEGAMWPTAYALIDWTAEVEERVAALVRKAVS